MDFASLLCKTGELPGRLKRRLQPSVSFGEWLPEVCRLPVKDNRVALSFDDGPTPETTPEIIELLSLHDAKATFFLTGVRAAAHPDLVQAIVHAGHDVFGHGWEHIRYDETGPECLVGDIDRCEFYLRQFRPTPSPYLVRLPHTAGHRCAWIYRALRRWNPDVQFAHYSVTLLDWLMGNGCETYEDVEKSVEATLSGLPYEQFRGKIVLLHEMPFGAHVPAHAAVGPIVLKALLEQFTAREFKVTSIIPQSRQSMFARFMLVPYGRLTLSPVR